MPEDQYPGDEIPEVSDDIYEELETTTPNEGDEPTPDDIPLAMCPTCGRPWDSAAYPPGAGNVW